MRNAFSLQPSAFSPGGEPGARRSRASSRKPRAARREPIKVEVSGTARGWTPTQSELAAWAAAALGRKAQGRELSVRFVARGESRALNARYRGRDAPTNVLSFPAGDAALEAFLGDLVICPAVLRREALEQGKSMRAHWAHLVVHGALHLVGHDHENDQDAQRMERREIAVLRRLGFANPYRRSV
jgi:probable rRNA maturation factor